MKKILSSLFLFGWLGATGARAATAPQNIYYSCKGSLPITLTLKGLSFTPGPGNLPPYGIDEKLRTEITVDQNGGTKVVEAKLTLGGGTTRYGSHSILMGMIPTVGDFFLEERYYAGGGFSDSEISVASLKLENGSTIKLTCTHD